MWSIVAPNLNDAVSDLDKLVTKGVIDQTEKPVLMRVVRQYDKQKGSVSDAQHDAVPSELARRIFDSYDDTYESRSLFFIREAAQLNVGKCPYCSINEPVTLDHYMPKQRYKALSLCRLNLTPICSTCNTNKGYKKPFLEFVHPYYTQFPEGVRFFKCSMDIVENELVVSYYFDKAELHDSSLYDLLNYHFTHLHLSDRLAKESVDFLNRNVRFNTKDKEEILASLESKLDEVQEFWGLNDWRSALLAALADKVRSNDDNSVIDAIQRNRSLSRSKTI